MEKKFIVIYLMKYFIFLILFMTHVGCSKITDNKFIDNEKIFNFKAKSNLYSLYDKPKLLHEFIEYANYENIARKAVKQKCINYINERNFKNVKCKFMGVKFTEAITTSLD